MCFELWLVIIMLLVTSFSTHVVIKNRIFALKRNRLAEPTPVAIIREYSSTLYIGIAMVI